MSKSLNIAQKIKSMKVGQHFTVATETERQIANREGKTLFRAGVITFQIVTRKQGDGWKIAAI